MNTNLDSFIALTEKYVDMLKLTQTIVNEYIRKSVVLPQNKSSGKRQQKIKIYFNFLDKVEIPALEQSVTP